MARLVLRQLRRDDVGPASAYSLLLAENIPDLTGKIAVDLGTDSEMEYCTDFRLNSTFQAISTRSFPSSYPNYSPACDQHHIADDCDDDTLRRDGQYRGA